MGVSFTEILEDPLTKKLLGHDAVHAEKISFLGGVTSRLSFLLNDKSKHLSFMKIGYTALEAFLQANVTGPPLEFDSELVIFPSAYRDTETWKLKQEMLDSLVVDGNAPYGLTPRVELFWLGRLIMANSTLAESGFNGRRARFRVNFWHQKLLSEPSDSLKNSIYEDAEILEQQLSARFLNKSAAAEEHFVEFLTERAAIRTFYGDDERARDDLARVASIRTFRFALTGALGKRTRFQEKETSQLVVLAISRDHEPEPYSSRKSSRTEESLSDKLNHVRLLPKSPPLQPTSPAAKHQTLSPLSAVSVASELSQPLSLVSRDPDESSRSISTVTQPENLKLNDDTLLENIEFGKGADFGQVTDANGLSTELANLDVSNQPQLFPVDSIVLLTLASSISNTSPADGLTREETMPYATRVLEGGSSNWQVYTQALLVRSRIEGYRSRTAERGLLQLQALVDQVIAETTALPTTQKGDVAAALTQAPTTFLPKPSSLDSASVAERLKYIYQISPPLRWELEAELAQRWTTMGGLRSALEIYERLQMHAEVALCLAATDREAEATFRLKNLLFEDPPAASTAALKFKRPGPGDSPRLLCILGDIEQNPRFYEAAWEASRARYARAQRSLGRYFSKHKELSKAATAYTMALNVTRLDNSTWFALGCIQLELQDYSGAVDSFTKVIQLEDKDAEGWSNLAVALLRLPQPSSQQDIASMRPPNIGGEEEEDTDAVGMVTINPFQHTFEALRALRRAANLKRDDARIWDNYLTVAASIPPSQGTPWNEIIHAMSQVIALRSPKQGEAAVDTKVLEVVVKYVTQLYEIPRHEQEGNRDEAPEHDNSASIASATDQTDSSEPAVTPQVPTETLPFTARSLLTLIDKQITPLASSPELFAILSHLALWRRRPAESLSYAEKAWRATTTSAISTSTSSPSSTEGGSGNYESEADWNQAVTRTITLVNAYRDLGDLERERTGGPVENAWRFKARSAIRSVQGRGKEMWEGSAGWDELVALMATLKN